MNNNTIPKNIISIFCLPQEVDDLELMCDQLLEAFKFLNKPEEWLVDVSLGVSKELVDWKNSDIEIEYFQNIVNNLIKKTKDININIELSEHINGCVDKRKQSYIKYPQAVSLIWLDLDMVFKPQTLAWLENAINFTKDKYPYSIITPEIVRVWDESWDCLVNNKFLNKPLRYHETNNPYKDSFVSSEVSLELVDNSKSGPSEFKFGGGLMTCISGKLLRKVGIPESFSPYGQEDTFVMYASEILKQHKVIDPYQFKLKGVIICENIKYRKEFKFIDKLKSINKTAEFRAKNSNLLKIELNKLYNKLKVNRFT